MSKDCRVTGGRGDWSGLKIQLEATNLRPSLLVEFLQSLPRLVIVSPQHLCMKLHSFISTYNTQYGHQEVAVAVCRQLIVFNLAWPCFKNPFQRATSSQIIDFFISWHPPCRTVIAFPTMGYDESVQRILQILRYSRIQVCEGLFSAGLERNPPQGL